MPKKSNAKTFLLMLLLLAGMGVILFFASAQGKGGIFDLRNRASTGLGVATLTFAPPATTVHYVGDVFPIDVMLAANGKNISGVAFRYIFPNSGIVNVVDQDPNLPDAQVRSFATTLDPSFNVPVNQSAAQPSGQVYIDYAATTNLASG